MVHKSVAQRDLDWQQIEKAKETIPVRVVAIETIGNCNRACGYCPVSAAPKRSGSLRADLVYKCIEELHNFNYSKKFVFHFYNEPLLDKRILQFVDFASNKLPKAQKLLTTNGDLLNVSKLQFLLERGFNVALSAHEEKVKDIGVKLKESLSISYREKFSIREYYRVGDGSRKARITNRGGSIDLSDYASDEVREADEKGCGRVELNIDYLGNVHPCCMDFDGGYILGNINNESLESIWLRTLTQYKEHFFGKYRKAVCLRCAKLV